MCTIPTPTHRPYDCAIDLIPNSFLPSSRPCQVSQPEQDHKNLAYIQTAKKLNSCQAWWALLLTRYNFTRTKNVEDPRMLSPNYYPRSMAWQRIDQNPRTFCLCLFFCIQPSPKKTLALSVLIGHHRPYDDQSALFLSQGVLVETSSVELHLQWAHRIWRGCRAALSCHIPPHAIRLLQTVDDTLHRTMTLGRRCGSRPCICI